MNESRTLNGLVDVRVDGTGWAGAPAGPTVPERYWGVWSRSVLETPELRDTTTLVYWMQLGLWHVDLRVPQQPGAALQGFSGTTKISQIGAREICTWQRLVDYQPPRATVDEAWMVFKTPQQVEETGVRGVYFEVWNRLAGSNGRRIALAEPARSDGARSARIFVSGDYLMRVRPAEPLSPAFEISFGRFANGRFSIEASTLACLAGSDTDLSLIRSGEGTCEVCMDSDRSHWQILEWAGS
jgi:hypothetical protein